MQIRALEYENFVNYKKISMFIGMPFCTFKCCVEKNIPTSTCQNCELMNQNIINVSNEFIINIYTNNSITEAVVFGGMEPMDSFDEIYDFIKEFRKYSNDDIVIYTGYTEDEVIDKIELLANFKNIIIKFGRFIPNEESHRDDILGVNLTSSNQYGKVIS